MTTQPKLPHWQHHLQKCINVNPRYKEKIYSVTTEATFKLRHSNHQKSIKLLKYKTDTALSNEVWRMKKSRQTTVNKWEVVRAWFSYNSNSENASYV